MNKIVSRDLLVAVSLPVTAYHNKFIINIFTIMSSAHGVITRARTN